MNTSLKIIMTCITITYLRLNIFGGQSSRYLLFCKDFANIGLADKTFRFLPLDDFRRSKSFFSVENFSLYMAFVS